jgi:hypothetical protein
LTASLERDGADKQGSFDSPVQSDPEYRPIFAIPAFPSLIHSTFIISRVEFRAQSLQIILAAHSRAVQTHSFKQAHQHRERTCISWSCATCYHAISGSMCSQLPEPATHGIAPGPIILIYTHVLST